MKAKAIFNTDGSVTIETNSKVRFVFTTTSEAVNFCNERNINASIN